MQSPDLGLLSGCSEPTGGSAHPQVGSSPLLTSLRRARHTWPSSRPMWGRWSGFTGEKLRLGRGAGGLEDE